MPETRLRGLNFGGWLSQIDAIIEKDRVGFPGVDGHMEQFIGKEDFELQRTWGFNHVRLPLDAYCFFDEDGAPLEARMRYIDRAVQWAQEAGLTLILDLHECPGHDFAEAVDIPVQKLFVDEQPLRLTEKIWAHLAERYGEFPHLCFEPLNEPVAPDAATWNRIKGRICAAIRSHAPRRTIVVGSNMWNWASTYRGMTPLGMDNVIYCFHFYEPLLFTHQKAPWIREPEIRGTYTYPDDYGKGFTRKYGFVHSAGRWDRNRFAEEIAPVVEFGRANGASVICDEFGVYAPVPMELQLRWYDDLLSVLREMSIGFSCWNYKNLDFGITSKGERLHEKLPNYDNPERVNRTVLELLQKQ